MARHRQAVQGAAMSSGQVPEAQPLGYGEKEQGDVLPPLVRVDGEVVGSAVGEAGEAPAVPIPEKFIVEADRRVAIRGTMMVLRRGKVLDERMYDVPTLVGQGLQVRKL